MVVCLIFLGVVTLLRIGGVPVKRLTAVLGAADRNVGVGLVEVVEPGAVHIGLTAVPTEVVVVGYNVGNLDIGIVDLTHRNRCNSGATGIVHLVAEVVKNVVVLDKIGVRATDGDLVGETPNYDRGVVVVLSYKLGHLADSICATGRHMAGDVGNLCPDNHTVLVTEIVEVLVVLVVSKTDGGAAYLIDKLHILLVMLGKKCVTEAKSVLVTGYTAEGILLAVKEEATLGIDIEGTATETRGNVIDNLVAIYDLSLAAVKVGVATAVPEVNALDLKYNLLVRAYGLVKLVALLIIEGVCDLLTCSKLGGVNLNLNLSVLATDLGPTVSSTILY